MLPEAGSKLKPLVRTITQDTINEYAEASGDHNPLHVDPEFATTTRFEGPIAHGMLLLAYISEMMTANLGEPWVAGSRMKARFRGAARPGDTVTCSGTVTMSDEAGVNCRIECTNQDGEVLVSADASVKGAR